MDQPIKPPPGALPYPPVMPKACPFCKGFNLTILNQDADLGGHFVHCLTCHADGPVGRTIPETQALWNQRPA